MSNNNQVFVNPYNSTPTVWHAQGAYISWGRSLSQAQSGLSDKNASNGFSTLTGVTVQFVRTVSTQYPIGGSKPLQLIGAPTGTANFTSLLGPQQSVKDFLKAVSDACDPVFICIQPFALQTKTCAKSAKYDTVITLCGCISNQVSLAIQAGGGNGGVALVNVPIGIQFTDMLWS